MTLLPPLTGNFVPVPPLPPRADNYLLSQEEPGLTDGEYMSSKTFSNYPCAHRQWKHKGNCALVHGYSRSFQFLFGAKTRDACGFVVDFGELDWLKAELDRLFDHTLLIAGDDPLLDVFQSLHSAGACALRILPYGVGMEDTAQYLCELVDAELRKRTKGRCWVMSVEARENDKNSATYINPNGAFLGWLTD